MTTTYADTTSEDRTQSAPTVRPHEPTETKLTLLQRVTTPETLAFTGIALLLLVIALIADVAVVYVLALVAILTAANFAATARAQRSVAITSRSR